MPPGTRPSAYVRLDERDLALLWKAAEVKAEQCHSRECNALMSDVSRAQARTDADDYKRLALHLRHAEADIT
jgi:hypothetical protein